METIGDCVRDLRNERHLTIKELAERAGLSWNAVSRVELGYRSPSADTIVKLAHGLGVEPGDLFPKATAPKESAPSQVLEDVGGIPSAEALDAPVVIKRVEDLFARFDRHEINVYELRKELIDVLKRVKPSA